MYPTEFNKRNTILVSYFIIFNSNWPPVRLIGNNLIMIFNLSAKYPRRVSISKAWGQKGAHTNFSLFVGLKSIVLLFLSAKLHKILRNGPSKDWVSKVATIFFSPNWWKVAETKARSSRAFIWWSSSEARKRNYHAYGTQLSLCWCDFSADVLQFNFSPIHLTPLREF